MNQDTAALSGVAAPTEHEVSAEPDPAWQESSSFAELLAQRNAHGRPLVHRKSGTFAQAIDVVRAGSQLVMSTSRGPVAVYRARGPFLRVEEPASKPKWKLESWLRRVAAVDRQPFFFFGAESRGHSLASPPGAAPPSPLARTVRFMMAERGDIGVLVVYGVALGLLSLAVPIAVQSLVNTVAFGSLLQPLVVLTVLLAVALLGGAYLRALQIRVVEMLQRRLFVRVVTELADRLPKVRSDAFHSSHGPELLNRFFDVFTTQKSIAALLLGGIDATLIALFGMIVLAFYHPALLAFDVVLVLSAVIVFLVLGRGGSTSSVKESKSKYAVAAWLEEMARHPLSFKLAGGPHFGRRRVEALATDYLTKRDDHFRVVFRQVVGALGMQVAASVALLAVGGYLVIARQLSIGQLVAAELIVTAVVASIAKLGNKVEVYYDLLAAVDKIGEILDLETEEDQGEGRLQLPARAPLKVVSIPYAEDLPARLSFQVETGQVIAFVGFPEKVSESVSDRLYGLRRITQGGVQLGEFDQRDLNLQAWRAQVALVRQPEVLPCSILENVRAADPSLASDEVGRLLATVGLREDVFALQDGLRTVLGPSGSPLSQSQAVRLTIARALAAKPRFLILDEALERLERPDRVRIIEAIQSHHDVGVLLFTHDAELAARATTSMEFSAHRSGS